MGPFPTFFISPHPSSTYPIAPGDIKVFKDMPLISLTLYDCNKLTGVFGLGWGMVGGLKIGNRLRPQGITLIGNLSRNLLLSSSPFLHLPHYIPPGNIEVFKDMPLTSLILSNCYKLTGVVGLGQGMVGGAKIGNRLRPQGNTQRTFQGTFSTWSECSATSLLTPPTNTSSPFAGKEKAKEMFPNADVTV